MINNKFINKARVTILTVIVYLLAVSTGWAVTYYVDGTLGADCTSGNYSIASRNCSGLNGNAYNTIQESINMATSPGDTVSVRTGTYNENILLKASGTSGNYITIQAYSSETPIIQPSSGIAVSLAGHDYITINGFDIDGGTAGIYWVPNKTVGDESRYITISNNNIYDQNGNGIFVRAYHHTISGNTFSGASGGDSRAIMVWQMIKTGIDHDVYLVIEGNTFLANTAQDHIYLGGNHIIIRNNIFDGLNGGTGHDDSIQLECTNDVLIENNIFINTNNFDIDAWTCAATKILTGTRVIGNVFENISGYTIHLKGGTYEITGNTFTNATIGALRISDRSSNGSGFTEPIGSIKNNIFYSNTYNNWMDNLDLSKQTINYNLYFDNNTLVKNGDNGANSFIADPLFINATDLLGPDSTAWTPDDGFNFQTIAAGYSQDSPACGAGEGGGDISSYSCNGDTSPPSVTPKSPANINVEQL